MTILNNDLQTDCDTTAVFGDGYWQRKGSRKLKIGGHAVRAAYLKTYFGSVDDELQSMIEEGLPESFEQEKILTPSL